MLRQIRHACPAGRVTEMGPSLRLSPSSYSVKAAIWWRTDSTLQTRTRRGGGGKRVGIMYDALLSEREIFCITCLEKEVIVSSNKVWT